MSASDDPLAHIEKAERHLEVARLLGEGRQFPHAVFYLLSATEEQARATLALAERDGVLTRDRLHAGSTPYLPPSLDYRHQAKMTLGIFWAVTQRLSMRMSDRRKGGVGWTERDEKEFEAVLRLFDDPTGLREAVMYSGKRQSGKPLPPPPGEDHYRALLPFITERADFLRFELGHPLSAEEREQTRQKALHFVRRLQAELKRSGFHKRLKRAA